MKRDSAWAGFTVVCMASGPSLTPEDAELVREWRDAGAARAVVVTNSTCFMAPWADALVAWDSKWWRTYLKDLGDQFAGNRFTGSYAASTFKAQKLIHPFQSYGNTGAAAISLALWRGAARVILLGYDCQKTDGKTHHHGSHPAGMSDAASIEKWPAKFQRLSERAEGKVVNCSRVTALRCFPMASLEIELDQCRVLQMEEPRLPGHVHIGARQHPAPDGGAALPGSAPVHLHHG